jgi:DNA end-binding protein Ku
MKTIVSLDSHTAQAFAGHELVDKNSILHGSRSRRRQGKGLMLELMHFPEELMDVSEFKAPVAKSVAKQELQMAMQLIDSLTSEWEPEKYADEYRAELEKLIQDKIEHGGEALRAPPRKAPASNIIDLAWVLRQSLQETQGRAKSGSTKTRRDSKKARSAGRSRKKVA